MSEFIRQYQNIIKSTDAREAGFLATKNATGKMLNEFFEDITNAVMSKGDDVYLIQWAISKLDEGERDAIEKGS